MNRSIASCRPCHRTFASTCGALAILLTCSCVVGEGADGVPGGVKKLEKSHKQATTIRFDGAETGATLQDFCVNRDGLVVALLAKAAPIGAVVADEDANAKKTGSSQVRILDSGGELVRQWDVDFVAQAIGTGPDGSVYVGGDGLVASFDAEGKLLKRCDVPQAALLGNLDDLRENAKEQLEAEKQAAEEQIKQFETMLKDEKQLEAIEKQVQAQVEQQAKLQAERAKAAEKTGKKTFRIAPRPTYNIKTMYAQQLKALRNRKDRTVDDMVAMITGRLKQINAIAVSGQDVFVACPMSKGYGYAVWRTDRDFQNPKQIISGLSGCCGQMDIQTSDDQVFVAENSRHRVVRYDRDGKQKGSFGKTDREGVGEGFSGCCNPMNLCFAADGALLAAESNGVVKRFTPDGEYEGMVGVAKVPEGCKNSAIGISSDGQHVYYIDIRGSNIIVLARDDQSAAKSE
jgi:hypothetical protein